MKKLGLLIDTMNGGGAQRVVAHLSDILSEDYDIHVILFEDTYHAYTCQGKQLCLNVPAKQGNVFVKLTMLWKRVLRLRKLVQQEQLDCVISFLDSPNIANLLAHTPKCRKVISIRNYSRLENRQNALGVLTDIAMKVLYRRADYVVAVSDIIKKDFITHYGIEPEKIRTIYNPYNFDDIHEKAACPIPAKDQEFVSGKFVFTNVGRIMYQKGIWHLVKAFSLVHEQAVDARLVIVGEDLSQGRLPELIRQLRIENAVLLVDRTQNPYQYMRAADCYVLSSLFEGFPNAMVEAMVCGCSIVAADCKSGPREILSEFTDMNAECQYIEFLDYGVLVPALEPREDWNPDHITDGERYLAQAMLEQYQDTDKRKHYAKKAVQRSSQFDYENCRTRYKKVVEG